ncbi:MAG TPA: NYN domain-containing protein [Hyphomicrobiales bacterium]|nr:NYN domain-containing protein [Kaistiaceae bacterium]HQF31446.1 NYN domain-containing protein [Hyphomicrobiales bacterium]
MLFLVPDLDRVAVFVDAGYLFAQGSVALTGAKKRRVDLTLSPQPAIDALKQVAGQRAPDCKLLRIYWYDGATGGTRPTVDQAELAELDDVKLRLGFINSSGQQKGVDSLIVTDLIELARLKSISEALLLSGDEDVRVGVQIAQNYGVRVHLLGIHPSRGSQSHQLLHEADTTSEWVAADIASFLSVREAPAVAAAAGGASPSFAPDATTLSQEEATATVETEVADYVAGLSDVDKDGIRVYWQSERGVPAEHDRVLLIRCGAKAGRQLTRDEIKTMRTAFRNLIAESAD